MLQFITLFLIMFLFLYVPSMKDKTFCRDNEPVCHMNNIMYSDHSVSVLQRWGTHVWVIADYMMLSSQTSLVD